MHELSASAAVAVAVTFTGMELMLMIPRTEVFTDPVTVLLNVTSVSLVKLGVPTVPIFDFKLEPKTLLANWVQLVLPSLAPATRPASSAACIAVLKLLARE